MPLHGIKILDFSQFIAGPYATMMLGDMGADIIKIEKIGSGDQFRSWTFFNQRFEDDNSPCYLAWNRNKKSLAIDFKQSAGKQLIYDLVQQCDIVVENFRPGVMKRLGFDYETLKSMKSDLIYASNTGYGVDGPYSTWPGQDLLIQGLSGLVSLNGVKSDAPTTLGTGLPDMLSSYHLVYGILSALLYKMRTGKGQKIDVDLFRSTLALESQELMYLLNTTLKFDKPKKPMGSPLKAAPSGIYPCKEGYIAMESEDLFKLANILDKQELLQYQGKELQMKHRDDIYQMIEEELQHKTVDQWLELFQINKITAVKVNCISEVKNEEAFETFTCKSGRSYQCVAPAVNLSETPLSIKNPPPEVGQHSKEILRSFGIEEDRIKELIGNSVVGVS